ncbi:DUF4390 domain-containing protein [Neisseria sp. Ec49-e6-T10]|uniref:DUF4390 domain-containing protein n=1 Tax=Neisseria sp. Ec49-e6-T10 TaxID=3140744 RepID=UPI003EB7C735
MNHVYAEDIGVVRARAVVGSQGQMLVSSRFNIALPAQLEDALKQGVSLNFKLAFNLDAPTYTAYKLKLSNWFSEAASVSYKISYHPLTDRYRVSIGSLSTDHTSLSSALGSIGGIANWQTLPKGTLKDVAANDVKASIRLSLTMDDLPKPFQINGITSKKWNLDTDWVNLAVSREKV